jgi:hypothetical protein
LFRSSLRVGIGPAGLRLVGRSGGWLKRDAAGAGRLSTVAVEPGRSPADWRPALEALLPALAEAGAEGGEVTVVLSNHFVRYALLAPNPALKKDAEWREFARHRLASIHGAVSDDWQVRVSAAQAGGVRIVSAADKALIEEVRAKVGDAGGSLVSAQPNLIAAFNRTRELIGDSASWLVIRESGRVTMALFEEGTWKALRTRRFEDGTDVGLDEILERECALLALPGECTRAVVYVDEDFAVDGGEPTRIADWRQAGGAGFASLARERAASLARERAVSPPSQHAVSASSEHAATPRTKAPARAMPLDERVEPR